jgi:NADH-quinone oxidoreductase subunit E
VAGEVSRAELRGAGGDGDLHVRRTGGGPDRDRRLARHGDGRGRPLSKLETQIRELATQYPDSRTAILPGLRLAQEENGGWLTLESFELVGDALGLTPAYCQAVASFYDMFHQAPVGRHSIEVCTNLSCALSGAQQVVEAFEQELGVAPGETTEDGAITLRTVECLGGCGYATVVAVDNRYREHVGPEDVPAIVEGVRGA